ncbi:hypothetical protein D3C78_1267990 [compost metagenome]
MSPSPNFFFTLFSADTTASRWPSGLARISSILATTGAGLASPAPAMACLRSGMACCSRCAAAAARSSAEPFMTPKNSNRAALLACCSSLKAFAPAVVRPCAARSSAAIPAFPVACAKVGFEPGMISLKFAAVRPPCEAAPSTSSALRANGAAVGGTPPGGGAGGAALPGVNGVGACRGMA